VSKPTRAATGPAVGRPRRFDDKTERRMVMDAALRVMARNGYAGMSVSDVLSEAGLSTRAFYRHFDSRETLLIALMRRESESVGRSLDRAVALAPNRVAALEAWLQCYLDVFYEPRRATRTALFSSPAVGASYLLADELRERRRIFCRPLIEALRQAHAAGVVHSPTPEADAYSMFALVSAATDQHDPQFLDRMAVWDHVIRFAWPAFELPVGVTP
jgi:AcrR family transcriptional regulator